MQHQAENKYWSILVWRINTTNLGVWFQCLFILGWIWSINTSVFHSKAWHSVSYKTQCTTVHHLWKDLWETEVVKKILFTFHVQSLQRWVSFIHFRLIAKFVSISSIDFLFTHSHVIWHTIPFQSILLHSFFSLFFIVTTINSVWNFQFPSKLFVKINIFHKILSLTKRQDNSPHTAPL